MRQKTGKQGGTALIRPMHYGFVVYGIFLFNKAYESGPGKD